MVASWLLSCLHLRTDKTQCRVFSEHPSPSDLFERDLTESLEKLSNYSSSDLISLSWLSTAMDMVMTTQEAVKETLLEHPDGIMAVPQVQKYFDDSVKLLDVFSMLDEAVGRANECTKAAVMALEHLRAGPNNLVRARHALRLAENVCKEHGLHEAVIGSTSARTHGTKQLTSSSSMLRRMGDKLIAPESHKGDIKQMHALSLADALPSIMYGAEMVTLVFSSLLSTFFLSSPKPYQTSAFSPLHISAQPAWAHPLLSLQAQIRNEILQRLADNKISRGSRMPMAILLPELLMMDAAFKKINEMLAQCSEQPISQELKDNMQHHGDSALKRVHDVQSCMLKLRKQLKSLSMSVLDIRMILLDHLPGNHR